MKIFVRNLTMVFISIIFSILITELILNIYGIGRNNIIYNTSNYYGYYHAPNQLTIRRGHKITIDKIGNRNPLNNNFDNSNLFFLGDSVTYGGSVVNDDNIFAFLFANKIKKNFLNFSANGWGIMNIVNFIEFNNFYKKNTTYILTCITECYTRNLRRFEQNFFFTKKNSLGITFLIQYLQYKISQLNFRKTRDQNEEDIDNEKTIELSIKQLVMLNEKIIKNNSRLIILFSPDVFYFKKKLNVDLNSNEEKKLYYQDFIKKKILEKNLEIYNIADYFDNKAINNYKLFFVDSVHLSRQGHELYSNIIEKIYNEQR